MHAIHAKPYNCVLAMLADRDTVAIERSRSSCQRLLICCSQKMGGNMIHLFGYFCLPSLPSKICSTPRRYKMCVHELPALHDGHICFTLTP